ncbi:GntR family transcriptional regulator [Kineobactrum salinum]|uniref:GntR family transcriptional regulator n=1 Tax=Kineobactrum salinum TaxID=2708301 RepID=A0A6C0U373_9GAMM|nr:GntR family transcriptional regulator [Kineobactrum salinum]QIB65889.1 GntR family transcriptional regulator [Kineobactrum salinum]
MTGMTATLRAYTRIREQILDGRLPQGSRVREGDMSALLALSRTPVREALKLLTAEGFLDSEPNKGVTVAIWSDVRVFDAYTVRATLEGLAASMAAHRATEETLRSLHAVCDSMDELLERGEIPVVERVSELNNSFHDLVVEAARNSVLAESIHRLSQVPAHRTFKNYSIEDLRRSFRQHRQLAKAITSRDSMEAEIAMKAHIMDARAHWASVRPDLVIDSECRLPKVRSING